jgi:hypothetical protein
MAGWLIASMAEVLGDRTCLLLARAPMRLLGTATCLGMGQEVPWETTEPSMLPLGLIATESLQLIVCTVLPQVTSLESCTADSSCARYALLYELCTATLLQACCVPVSVAVLAVH